MRQLFHKNFASLLLSSETDSKAYDFIICMYVKWLFGRQFSNKRGTCTARTIQSERDWHSQGFPVREGLAPLGLSNQRVTGAAGVIQSELDWRTRGYPIIEGLAQIVLSN
jgi:hypothetical protein